MTLIGGALYSRRVPISKTTFWNIFLLFIFGATIAVTAAEGSLYNNDENIFSVESLDDVAKIKDTSNVWMVQFYNPESETCKAMVATYTVLGKLVNGIAKLAVIDATTDTGKDIAKQFGGATGIRNTANLPLFFTLSPSPFDNSNSKLEKYKGSNTELIELASNILQLQSNVMTQRGAALGLQQDPSSSKGSSSSGKSSAVVELNSANFDTHVLQNPNVVAVAFIAPWCGHCKKLKPEWEEAAKRLEREEGIMLGWLDATANEMLAARFNVQGFPTIKIFPGGAPKTPDMAIPYEGGRDADLIVQNLLKELDKSGVVKEIPELTSQDVLEEHCAGQNHICVLTVLPHIIDTGADGRNKYRNILTSVSKLFRGTSFSFLWFELGAQIELEYALELTFGAPAVVAYSMDRKAYTVLHGSFSEKSISGFLNAITIGKQKPVPLRQDLPTVITVEPWDGNDASPIEDEIPLSEIMGDDEF